VDGASYHLQDLYNGYMPGQGSPKGPVQYKQQRDYIRSLFTEARELIFYDDKIFDLLYDACHSDDCVAIEVHYENGLVRLIVPAHIRSNVSSALVSQLAQFDLEGCGLDKLVDITLRWQNGAHLPIPYRLQEGPLPFLQNRLEIDVTPYEEHLWGGWLARARAFARIHQLQEYKHYCARLSQEGFEQLLRFLNARGSGEKASPPGRRLFGFGGEPEQRTWNLYKLLGKGDGSSRPQEIPSLTDVLPTLEPSVRDRWLDTPAFRLMYYAEGDSLLAHTGRAAYADYRRCTRELGPRAQALLDNPHTGAVFKHFGNNKVDIDSDSKTVLKHLRGNENALDVLYSRIRNKRLRAVALLTVLVAGGGYFFYRRYSKKKMLYDWYHVLETECGRGRPLTVRALRDHFVRLNLPVTANLLRASLALGAKMAVLEKVAIIRFFGAKRLFMSIRFDFDKAPKEERASMRDMIDIVCRELWKKGSSVPPRNAGE